MLWGNTFVYCANNPINFCDPNGEFLLTAIITCVVVGAVAGAAVGGTVAYNSAKSSGQKGTELLASTVSGAAKGGVIGGVTGGVVGVAGAGISCGLGSFAGTAAITGTITITAKATEVTVLQAKKSMNDGDNGWQIANDCIDAVFSNGGKICSPVVSKAGTLYGRYLITDIVKHKVVPLEFGTFAKGSAHKSLSYGVAALSVYHTVRSCASSDPISRANERGYKIGKDICNALVLCKKHEIVHRDIKPQNIFVSANGDYKLGDFGIAKTVEKTMGGTKIGTYKYMAPEVYNNQPYGSTADIYSLGLVLYWLLNERRMPFMPLPPAKIMAGQDEEARHRRLSGEKLPAPAHGSGELKRIVLKACAHDPKDRYTSAAAMLDDLNEVSGGAEVILPTVILDDKAKEKQEDDKTTGPVFGGIKKEPSKVSNVIDSDATVGPTFVVKQPPVKEPEIETPKSETVDVKDEKEKKSFLEYVLIALGVIALLVLFLLLRSCGENGQAGDPSEGTTGAQTTEGSTVAPEQLVWSEWVDALPEGVTAEKYEIEEKTLYSSRAQETTSSTEKNTMDGWELFDTVEANGEFGPWSDWSEIKIDDTDTREVDPQTRYRYKTRETTTGTSSSKTGWTRYDITYSWGGYGPWSGWSTTPVFESESRKVDIKTEYRYRNISYSTEYTTWSSWGDWSFERQSTSDLMKEDSRTVWSYYRYVCPRCGAYMHGNNCYKWAGGRCSNTPAIDYSYCQQIWSEISPDAVGYSDFHGTGDFAVTLNGETWYVDNGTNWSERYNFNSDTQYRYATRTTYPVPIPGNWSNWGDTYYSNSSSREVRTRTVYRYCDRTQVPTYHFYRWGNWSDWSTNEVSETNDRKVDTATHYRYRDRVKTTTYYFKRWTDWSAYSDTPVLSSETTEVQTKTQYRYKEKQK